MEYTSNGIEYEWSLAGPDGASFILFPEDKHTKEEIEKAKKELRRERDVVSLRVANKYDKANRFLGKLFIYAEKKHNIHWSQIEYDTSIILKYINLGLDHTVYVDKYAEQWKKQPINKEL